MFGKTMARILFIDNYDSFTHNLVQMFMGYDLAIDVFRCDKITVSRIDQIAPDYIVISPGPKDPAHAGISIDVVKNFPGKIPILGVCLGMQCINEAFGGTTVRAPVPVHGKTSRIFHTNEGVFNGIPSPFTAARYHSLMVRPDSTGLKITANSEDGVIMGISHPKYPVFGVQFHPESFLTDYGFTIIENFLRKGPLSCPILKIAA
jgi:anthranilate synthase component II